MRFECGQLGNEIDACNKEWCDSATFVLTVLSSLPSRSLLVLGSEPQDFFGTNQNTSKLDQEFGTHVRLLAGTNRYKRFLCFIEHFQTIPRPNYSSEEPHTGVSGFRTMVQTFLRSCTLSDIQTPAVHSL